MSPIKVTKHFLQFISSLWLFHSSNKTWPLKKLSQMVYITAYSFLFIISLKLILYNVPLRSTSKLLFSNSSSRILDIQNFRWLMNNETVCTKERSTPKVMVILVHTARDHFVERKSIRNTWGSLKSYKDWSLRVIFLLGDSALDEFGKEDEAVSEKISTEFEKHGDLVMGSFMDTYKNLRYKHLMGYKWILDYCSDATYVWKVDDDVFIDPLSIIEWRSNEIKKVEGKMDNASTKMIDLYCPVSAHSEPQRDITLKWYVPKEIWPHKEYPTYCSGWAYGISVPWIRKIYSVSSSAEQVLWIDDIFVTGILVQLANKLYKESPNVKDTWRYATFTYDPYSTTFCLNDSTTNNVHVERKFGAFGRLLRGSALVRENKCIWNNIILGKWDTIPSYGLKLKTVAF